jgi:tRNA(fMet)-specific endonuclease VapC
MKMSGRVLLDTNIIIALFSGDKGVTERLPSASAVFVPSIVLGELYYGAYKSTNCKSNCTKIDEFCTNSVVLPADEETARHYGRLKDYLRSKGKPVPENDIWIASLAEQYRLTLVSRDQHFNEISGLKVEAW